MNKLIRPDALGMPYHGLASGGELTIPGGSITVGQTYGIETPIVFRVPGAPGANRSTEQAAFDTARGYEWRDYVLLTGPTRRVNGGVALGANAWLYGDANGRVWKMTVDVSVASANVTVSVWRRELFGRFRVGGAYTITDEQVASTVIAVDLPPEYDGASTAAAVAATLDIDNAAMINPSPNGDVVHLHLCGAGAALTVLPATAAKFCGSSKSVYAIMTCTLSGTGDPADDGTGISGSFSSISEYVDLRELIEEEETYGTDIALYDPSWTSWDFDNDAAPDPPTGTGQTSSQTLRYVWEWNSTTEQWGGSTGNRYDVTLWRTQAGDVSSDWGIWEYGYNYFEYNGGVWESTINYVSEDLGGGSYGWAIDSQSYDTSLYEYNYTTGSRRYGEMNIDVAGQESEGYSYAYEPSYTENYDLPGGGGASGSGWPYTLPDDIDHDLVNTFSADALTGGKLSINLDFVRSVEFWPSVVIVKFSYDSPDGSSNYVLREIVYGIRENGTVVTIADQEIEVGYVPYNIVATVAFNPVTGDASYANSGASIKYI